MRCSQVRNTDVKTLCDAAPDHVRLPPQTLRFTTAGRIAHQTPSPMALIGYIDAQGPAFPSLSASIEEYWAPANEWKFLEFVCPSLTVTAVLGVVAEDELWCAGEDYEHDRQLARHRWSPTPDKKVQRK